MSHTQRTHPSLFHENQASDRVSAPGLGRCRRLIVAYPQAAAGRLPIAIQRDTAEAAMQRIWSGCECRSTVLVVLIVSAILSAAGMLIGAEAPEDRRRREITDGPEKTPFDAPILDERPRVFIRQQDAFDGLTVAKLRQAAKTPEFAGIRSKWRRKPLGRALLWMLDGQETDLRAAIRGLETMDARGGSWSDRGLALMRLATLFDWLYGELDAATRREIQTRIETAADAAVEHIRRGRAPFFYSRTPGALAGTALAGIALHGVSDRAEGYLSVVREWGVDDFFKALEWVEGAATGATYTFYYTYVDLACLCAAWWSATGENPGDWIRTRRGDWLDGIVRFYLWYLRPGFAFTHINDQSRNDWSTHDQFCQALDIASYVTRNGHGRAWSLRWLGRFGPSLYHTEYAHHFMFRDVTLEPRPLADLPLAELFGRESCGYGFFRSEWPAEGKPDSATHVFFRFGDPMNVHGGVAAGEFQVTKYAPLAYRGGHYASYDSAPDQYHRNCISTNVVLFTDPENPKDRGDQNSRRGLKSDHRSWDDWLAIRERNALDVATILDWQVSADEARCRADLTRANPRSKCRLWIRELVWLARRHLVVLDIVETPDVGIRRQWQLHLPERPRIADRTITARNEAPRTSWADPSLAPKDPRARLYCRTLLPEDYSIVLHAGGKAEAFDPEGASRGAAGGNAYHLQYGKNVLQIEPAAASTRTIFLHVLTATEVGETEPPGTSFRRVGPDVLEVRVGRAATRLSVPE